MLDLISHTSAGLEQLRHQWQATLAPAATDAPAGRLVEVTDLEPVPGQLRMLTYLPANLPPQAPLVVVLHGLDPASAREETVDGAARRVWRDARGREVLEAYLVPGLKHGAPVAPGDGARQGGAAGPFMPDAGISSTGHIADFWGLTKPRRKPAQRPVKARVAGLAARIGDAVRGIGRDKRPATA